MKKVISLGVILGFVPMFAFAADLYSVLGTLNNILNIIIPILITLAVVYFIWGIIEYITGDEEKKKAARSKIIDGLIGLFVIIAFWGIIRVVSSTFGVGPEQLNSNAIPCIPNPALNITCPNN